MSADSCAVRATSDTLLDTAGRPALRRPAALGLMLASGAAGLGYQIVWTQQCTVWLGHEATAVLAVVTAFFGGLALGAATLGARIERSERPERWYAACEASIASWSLALALLLGPVSRALLHATGEQPSPLWQGVIAFVGTFVVLLPATAAMGATLPAMARMISPRAAHAGGLATLYAANTAGAVIGVLATAFWLVPEFGLVRTALLCAVLNMACAAAGLTLRGASAPAPARSSVMAVDRTLLTLAITGALGVGYEVLVVRVLSQVAEDTVYTWALLLAIYLAGTAFGAAAWHRLGATAADAASSARRRLLLAQASACGIGAGLLWAAPSLQSVVQAAVGPGMGGALAAEAAMAVAAFALPTIAMGALFSHLCHEAQDLGHAFGSALALNTLGGAAAPVVFGVVLAPLLEPKGALLVVIAGYLALCGRRVSRAAWAGGAAIVAAALVAPPLAFVDVPAGGHVVSYRDGAMAAVSVVEDADGVRRLRINNRQQEGSSATRFADARQALLPLLLHPAPKRALFLGLGTGVTASAAAADSTLNVEAVELLPEVIEASTHFRWNDAAAPRLHLHAADARRFVRTTPARYDVIVADNFHPARSGSGALYTVEHFTAVRERLTPGGVFCQWLPLHQLDVDTMRSIVRSFVAVDPGAHALLSTNSLNTPVVGLLMRSGDARWNVADVRGRLSQSAFPEPLTHFALADEFALLGSFVAGPASLARFGAGAPLNTDDRPVVAYRAPRVTYAPESRPRERLLALLHEWSVAPSDVLDETIDRDAEVATRLAAYWQARQRYLEAGQDVQPMLDPQRMLAQVRAPLLEVLHLSPDFRPAYDALLGLALAVARGDPLDARQLLAEMIRIAPAWPEARQEVSRLAQAAP